MKTILPFATISLVMWLTLGSKEKQSQFDKEEAFEEMLDLEKRDAMPESWGIHYYFFLIYSKNTIIYKIE